MIYDYTGLPTRWVICEHCRGEGKLDNPAFSNGITSSEWADEWDEDSRADYMAGRYDVPCTDCSGSGKLREPDVSQMTFAQKRLVVEHRREARVTAEIDRIDRLVNYRESGCTG